MCRPPRGFVAEGHDGIEDNVRRAGFGGQLALLVNLVGTVIAHAADVAAARGHDVVEQFELGIPTIHDVQVIGGQMLAEHGFLIRLAAVFCRGEVHPLRHVYDPVKLRVQAPGVMRGAGSRGQPHSFRDPRQAGSNVPSTSDDFVCRNSASRGSRACGWRSAAIGEDVLQQFWIEDPHRLG